MLTCLLAWMYISLVSLVWGNIFLHVTKSQSSGPTINDPALICLAGLASSGTLACVLSIFWPIGLAVHLVLLLPVLIFMLFRTNRTKLLLQVMSAFPVKPRAAILLVACIVMTLALSSYTISHPDTLKYHIQNILWMHQFRAIPGSVHTGLHAGFQSLWFGMNALYHFDMHNGFPLFVNGAVLCWFFLFICRRVGKESITMVMQAILLFVLAFTLFSWTQVRLTAASASPDFIVSVYILAAGYCLIKNKEKDGGCLVVLFCATAIAIKLSAAVIILIPVYLIFEKLRKKSFRQAGIFFLISFMMILPILVRNGISSGYLFYPSDIVQFDTRWTISSDTLQQLRQYIRDYARTGREIPLTAQSAWLLNWWQHLAVADQMLLVALIILCIFNLFFFRKLQIKTDRHQFVLFFTCLLATCMWFVMAPDPRFATGFLLLLLIFLLRPILSYASETFQRSLVNFFTGLLCSAVIAYTTYRFYRYTEPEQILVPAGVKTGSYEKIACGNIMVNVPLKDSLCGAIPAPCSIGPCRFTPLGDQLTDGLSK